MNRDLVGKLLVILLFVLVGVGGAIAIYWASEVNRANQAYDLAHPPPPSRFEVLATQVYGTDPDDYVKIVCDHMNGTIIYENGRGGVAVKTPAEVHLSCDVLP